ncbi:uncharacterized protein BXZ73DRAFT_101997 [Epithele typhae]|uniref:uncharacterized protein n=1 Tax=Epithele typhae TaxID=378194 RepID=UPI002007CDD7|nr:uncharacterized protein BXZ73DRAFT_101997 [Epithele typhae]KAH9929935.1 hypothetical protein BXZ73DRAFT_101997 [Epithele typhae]
MQSALGQRIRHRLRGGSTLGAEIRRPEALDVEMFEDCIHAVDSIDQAIHNKYSMEWTIGEYMNIMPKGHGVARDPEQARLQREFPIPAATDCGVPHAIHSGAVIVDADQIPLVWALPDLLSKGRQDELFEATKKLKTYLDKPTTRTSSWRNFKGFFNLNADGGCGIFGIVPQMKDAFTGEVRESRDFYEVEVQDWLRTITRSGAILDAVLRILVPSQHQQVGEYLQENLPDGIPWPVTGIGLQMIFNRKTPYHRDVNSFPHWYDLLVTLGQYGHSAYIGLRSLGYSVSYRPGTVVVVLANIVEHALSELGPFTSAWQEAQLELISIFTSGRSQGSPNRGCSSTRWACESRRLERPRRYVVSANALANGPKPMCVFYGSNTGNSGSFAQWIVSTAPTHEFTATLSTLDMAAEHLPMDGPVLILTASFAGLVADNAKHFFEWADNVKQRAPKLIDDILEAWHGAVGLVEEEMVWVKLSTAIGLEIKTMSSSAVRAELLYQRDMGFGTVVENKVLTAECHPPKTHIELVLPEGFTYRAGDYPAIFPTNPERTVRRAMARFNLDSDTEIEIFSTAPTHFPIGKPISVFNLHSNYVELQQPATQRDLEALISRRSRTPWGTKQAKSLPLVWAC